MADLTQKSFTSGEISPSLRSRVDINKYPTGLALAQNFFVKAQGGAYTRPGTLFIGETDNSEESFLVPFSFSTEQTYILVFRSNSMQVIRNGGYVLSGSSRYTLSTPWTLAQVKEFSFDQDADVMTITHPDENVRELRRLADDSWQITTPGFSPAVQPPVLLTTDSYNITNVTSANPVEVTISGSMVFQTDDIIEIDGIVSGPTILNGNAYGIVRTSSSTFLLKNVDGTAFPAYGSGGVASRNGIQEIGTGAGSYDKRYSYVITTVSLSGDESEPTAVVSLVTASLSATAGIRLRWFAADDADYYRVYKDPSDGTGVYGWIGDSINLSFDDFNIAPILADSPPEDRDPFGDNVRGIIAITNASQAVLQITGYPYQEGDTINISNALGMTNINGGPYTVTPLSENFFQINVDSSGFPVYLGGGVAQQVQNKPAAVGYFQQRKIYANTTNQPQLMEFSQTGRDNSFRSSSPARDDDSFNIVLKGRQINEIRHILDVDALVVLTSGGVWRITDGQDKVLTPSTRGARRQSYEGAAAVRPAVVDDTVIYVQEKGSTLRDLRYDFADNKFSGNDISIYAKHLVENNTIVQMAYSDEPYGILWIVRDDGVLTGVTYQREQQVLGWHQHITDGFYESVAVVKEGNRDAVYVTVRRVINGATVRHVERFEPRVDNDVTDVFCVDAGLRYNGAATTSISGLDHLEGKTVAGVADGNEVKDLVVTSGQVTLPNAASKVVLGLPYTCALETLDIDTPEPGVRTRIKSVNKVYLEVENSKGGWVGPKFDRDATGDFHEIKPRYISDSYSASALRSHRQEVTLEPGWGYGGGVRVEQRSPFPLSILSITPDFDV